MTLPPPAAQSSFALTDWVVLFGYFAVLAVTGVIFSRRKPADTDDYFLGSRRMPAWAVAVSIVATSLSAVTFIGAPELAYAGNLTYLATNLGMVLAAVVIAVLFIPAFYRSGSASIYELLETRFGVPARRAASITFMIGRVLASGARIFAGAIPASIVLFGLERGTEPGSLITAIGILTVVGIVYTLAGGISSVIWSDVIQFAILIGAAVCAIVLILGSINAPIGEVLAELRHGGADGASKLTLLDTSWDLTASFSLPAALIGFTLLGIGSYGTDQDLAQRMLTCRNARQGAWSVIGGILLGIPSVAVFLTVGLLLWIVFQRPHLTNLPQVEQPGMTVTVFLHYILTQIPPGVRGLMMAGLFAAGLSSLNSAINSMSAAFISDLYRPIMTNRVPIAKSERHYVVVGRCAVVGWGLILGLFASLCIFWKRSNNDTLIDFALGVMAFAYAGLVGVFLTALLTKRGSSASVIAALGVGFAWMLITQPFLYNQIPVVHTPWLDDFYAIHYTWKLTIGVMLSFTTCVVGNRNQLSTEVNRAAPDAA
ncbi:MAG: sodium:solute symporter [Phycisphaerales bacterium]